MIWNGSVPIKLHELKGRREGGLFLFGSPCVRNDGMQLNEGDNAILLCGTKQPFTEDAQKTPLAYEANTYESLEYCLLAG